MKVDYEVDIDEGYEDEKNEGSRFHARRVMLTNLDSGTTRDMILKKLRVFGEISNVSKMSEDRYRRNRSVCFVTFSSSFGCEEALGHSGEVTILGRKVHIVRAYELTTVYLARPPRKMTAGDIRRALDGYDVRDIRIVDDGARFAVVDFSNEEERERALRQRFVTIGPRQFPILMRRPEQKQARCEGSARGNNRRC